MKTVKVQLCNPATASFYVLARHMHMSHMYIVRLHCTSMCRLFTLCRYTLDTMYLAQVQGVQAVPKVPGIGTGGAGKYMQVTLSILCPCLLTRHPGKYY